MSAEACWTICGLGLLAVLGYAWVLILMVAGKQKDDDTRDERPTGR